MRKAQENDDRIDINHLRQVLQQKFMQTISQIEVEVGLVTKWNFTYISRSTKLIERKSFTREHFQSVLNDMQLDPDVRGRIEHLNEVTSTRLVVFADQKNGIMHTSIA